MFTSIYCIWKKAREQQKEYRRSRDPQKHRPPTATDPVAFVNSNNNNNGMFQELEQHISRTQTSSLNTESFCKQNSDASNNSISSTSGSHKKLDQLTSIPIIGILFTPIFEVKKEDAAAANSISESTNFRIWEKGESIGSGGFGIVYVARNRETGALCAVKELKDIHKLENTESLHKEIKILSQLEHPNIVKYYGHEEDGNEISVYMEFIQPGSLKKYILKRGALHETLIRKFTAQILAGLVYLQSKRVVHRDLKPDNILVDTQDNVKLVDFGVSKQLAESMGNHSMWGTAYYTAVEVLDKKIEYKSSGEAYAADIWSLGCVIIEMLSGKHPWPDCDQVQAFCNLVVKKQCPLIPDELCKEGKHFLEQCFRRTPADRPSAAELQNHPFVKPQNLSC